MSKFAIFRCRPIDSQEIVEICAEDIQGIRPLTSETFIIDYYNDESCINETLFCSKVETQIVEI